LLALLSITTSGCNGSLVFSGPQLRENAAKRNDHSGFVDRMGAEHPPAKPNERRAIAWRLKQEV